MGLHHEVLATIVDELKSRQPECAIVLIGSVAAGTEQETSDLDLNLFFPDEETARRVPRFVGDDNRWQLQVKRGVRGVRIDVAWETFAGLAERLQGDGPADCWSFSRGTILYDPHQNVTRAMRTARSWFDVHPEVVDRLQGEYLRAKEAQSGKHQGR